MADNAEDNVLSGIDREFGVLSFNGEQQYFALDGQHCLKAIKEAIKQKPELAAEDIGVIVVPHFDDAKGRQQTRRLFTNINRNAANTSAQENLALDEDDGLAILTRRFLDEHPFLGRDGVVQVFSKVGEEGNVKMANRQVPVGGSHFTTIGILYDLLRELRFGLPVTTENLQQRADDEVLEDGYQQLSSRIDHSCVTTKATARGLWPTGAFGCACRSSVNGRPSLASTVSSSPTRITAGIENQTHGDPRPPLSIHWSPDITGPAA